MPCHAAIVSLYGNATSQVAMWMIRLFWRSGMAMGSANIVGLFLMSLIRSVGRATPPGPSSNISASACRYNDVYRAVRAAASQDANPACAAHSND
jgi:hypothetical protein